jgi:hypothetical protein
MGPNNSIGRARLATSMGLFSIIFGASWRDELRFTVKLLSLELSNTDLAFFLSSLALFRKKSY